MSLKLIENGLDGLATFSEGETQPIWCISPQAYYYVEESRQYNLIDFCNGVQICEVDLDSMSKYFTEGFQVINKYKALFKKEHYDRFIEHKEYFNGQRKVEFYIVNQIGGGNRQSHLKFINKQDSKNINQKLSAELVENGERIRQSIIAGITNLKFERKNGNILLTLEIIDKWGDVLMKRNKKVNIEKLVVVFEQEVERLVNTGKSMVESAQIFGVRYQPLINNNNMDVVNIIKSSKYSSNAAELIEAVNNGMKISPDIIWESKEKTSENDILSYNVYGIHIKKDNDALSDERPHICIGWSGMNDLFGLNTKEEINARHASTYPDNSPNSRGQDVGQIHRFKNEAKIGDYVVFAEQNVCHIGRITSEYYYDTANHPNQSDDYVNVRDVEWLKTNIKRSDLSDAFHNSLGAGMSFWGLNDYKSAINDLLNDRYKKDEVEDLYEDEEIFSGFEPWLTSYDNPDYTGKQKYAGYAKALVKLVDFMYEQKLIDDSDLNDKSIDKYYSWLDAYSASEVAKEYDEKKLSSKAGSAALKKYIKYVEYLVSPRVELFDYSKTKGNSINKIFYGTPGCGKSYHIQHNILEKENYAADNVIRTTFYQDYSNTDFVGQILPKIEKDETSGNETVKYIFNPGPFTLALIRAISNPTEKVALVVEEINRGNAPAIFGDIFQLLDRDADGISEYGIVNVSVLDYLNDYVFEVNGEKKNYIFKEIKIPRNMDIFATMNTSDQNVYTLDTAFVRRWDKEKIKNSFVGCKFAGTNVPGMNYTWQEFVTAINNHIAKHLEDLQVNEDKQIGVFFVKESLLGSTPEKFAYKVFDYLWSDVAKLDHGIFFNHFDTLEALITAYEKDGVGVFKTGIFDKKETPQTVEEDENNE